MEKPIEPVVVEQQINQPVDRVWNAITQKDEMTAWFFPQMAEFKPEVGFQTAFDVEFDGKTYRHLWKVTEVKAPERLTLNWKYAGVPGDSYVTFELIPQGEKTKVRLTHSFVQRFPEDDPVFSWQSTRQGWEYFIRQSLKEHCDGA